LGEKKRNQKKGKKKKKKLATPNHTLLCDRFEPGVLLAQRLRATPPSIAHTDSQECIGVASI
jgi:hypothetical protein